MDSLSETHLFVINRYEEANHEKPTDVDEKANLAKLYERIEKNKRKLLKNKKKKDKINKEVDSNEVTTPQETSIKENTLNEKLEESDDSDEPTTKKPKFQEPNIEGFTVLGSGTFDKKAKVKRVLPKWLANPTVISVNLQDLQTKVSSMKDLDKGLRKKLRANGIRYLFPVQAEVVPWLIKAQKESDYIFPRDICVSAPTGSGKTLAFVLPIIQALKSHFVKQIRALVILPTQDLALQVFKTFKKYSDGTNLNVCLITGRSSFQMEQKQLILENEAFGFLSRADILICTAGRLVDHLKGTKGFNLKHLEYLIIDEADRVLDHIQNDWLYHLEKHNYPKDTNAHNSKILNLINLRKHRPPQKLLFSATLSQDPEKLEKLSLFQPKLFTSVVEGDDDLAMKELNVESFIGKYTTPKELTEKYIECSVDIKPLVLYKFIKQENLTRTAIFTHSTESAHRLAILLHILFKDERKIQEISTQLDINGRNTIMDSFQKGNIDIIVCTDRLARGIDLPGIKCVVSYTAPKYLKTYIHRAGRTARAGEEGLAVTLASKIELNKFLTLLQSAGKKPLEKIEVPEDGLETLYEQYKDALNDLKKSVSAEVEKKLRIMKSAKRIRRFKKK